MRRMIPGVNIWVWHTIKIGRTQPCLIDQYEPAHIWYQKWDFRPSTPGIGGEQSALNDRTHQMEDGRINFYKKPIDGPR